MKYIKHVLVLIICIVLSGCQAPGNSELSSSPSKESQRTEETAAHQAVLKLSLSETTLRVNEGETINLAEVGLHNLTVKKKVKANSSAPQEESRFAYILCDYRYGDATWHDSYFAMETAGAVLFYDLGGRYLDDALYLNDIDGNGADDIIVQQCVDVFGGAGTFLSRVFKVEENTIVELFNSSTDYLSDDETSRCNTGFSSEFLENHQLRITNASVGYSTTIDLSGRYADEFFDETGKGKLNNRIICDSFMEFSPKDVDNDDIFEIVCSQYVSLYGHADGIGYAKSVLKFDTSQQKFIVINAKFDTMTQEDG